MGERLARYLKRLCEEQKISLGDISDQIDADDRFLCAVEEGTRNPSIPVLHNIVATLDGDLARALILLALDLGIPADELQGLPGAEDAEKYDDELP